MPPKKKLKYLSEVVACANQIDTIVIKDHQVTHHSHDLKPSKSVSLESNDQLLLSIAREAKKKAKMEKEVSKANGPNEVSSTRNKVPNPLEIQSERMEFLRNIGDGHQFNHPFHYSTSCTSDSPKLNDQSLYSIARAAKENVVNLKKSHQVLKENGHKSVALGSQVGKGSITSVENHLAGHKSAASKSQVGKDSTRVVRHNVADHKVAALGSQIVKDSTGVVEHNVAGHKSVALGSQVGKDSAGAVKHNVADHKVVSLGSQVGKDSTEVVEHNVAGHKSVALRSQVGKDFVGDVEHNVACVPKEKVTNFKRNPLVAKGNGHKRVSLGSGKGSIRDGEYYATWTNEACSPTYKVPNPLEIQSKETNFLGTVENGTREICSPTYKVATPEEILSRAMDYFKIIEDGHKKVSLGFFQGSTIDGDHYVTGTNEVRSPTYKVPNPLDIQSKATNFLGAVEKGTREVCPSTYKVATPQEIQIKAMDFLRIIEDDHQVNNLSQYSTPCRVESSGFNAQSLHAISCSAKEKAQIMKKNPQPPTANGTKEVHSPNYKVPNHLEIKSKDLEYLGNFEDGRPLRNGAFEVGQGCTRLVEDHVTDNGFSHLHQVPTTFVEDHITLSGEGGFTNQMPRSPEIQSRGTYFSKNTNDESVRLGVDTERCLSQQQEDIENMSYHTRKRSRRATFEKYTENNDSREIKEKKGRGWTGYKSIKPPLGKTHHDCWTLKNVPVGVEGGILVRFLGLKARESDSFPLHLQWTDLQDKNFLAVWVEVKKLFRFKSHETKFTPNMYCVMRWCEARVQNSVTTYRHNLKKWLSTLTPEQLQFSPESRVSQEQWHHLLIYWSKEETKLVAQQNVTNRANIRPTCTLGSKSMRRKQFELMLEGHEASDCHTYIIAHKNKKGEFPDENTKTKMEEVQAEALRRNVQDSYNPLEFIPVVDHVYGDHHGGYQRGYGHGLTRQLLKEAAMMEMAQQTYQEIEKEAAFHAQELANAKRRMAHMMGQDRSSSSHARGSNSNEDGPSSQAEHSNNIWMGSHMQHSHKD